MKTKIIVYYIILLCFCFNGAYSQTVNLTVKDFPNEPAVAVNPKNDKRILVGCAVGQAFLSENAGKSFKQVSLDKEYGLWSDPSVFFDEKGDAYYFHLSGTTKGNSSDRIVCQKMGKKDTSFKVINTIAQTNTKFACNERPIALYNYEKKEIYLTYVLFDAYGSNNPKDSTRLYFTKSTDKGLSWSEPIRLSSIAGDCSDMDKSVQGATTTYNMKGEIFVCWANNERIYLNKSIDGGKTWLKKESIVANQPGGWDFAVPGIKMPNGLPVIVADRSKNEKTAGNLYVFWADQRIKSNVITNAYVSISKDQGLNWTEPKRIQATPFNTHQYHVWAAIDQENGDVYASFYQTDTDKTSRMYVVYSDNGGKQFKNKLVEEPTFTAQGEQYLGDMNQIEVLNGTVFLPSIKAITEKNQLYFTTFKFTTEKTK